MAWLRPGHPAPLERRCALQRLDGHLHGRGL